MVFALIVHLFVTHYDAEFGHVLKNILNIFTSSAQLILLTSVHAVFEAKRLFFYDEKMLKSNRTHTVYREKTLSVWGLFEMHIS